MADKTKELLQLKEKLENLKTKRDQTKGQLDELVESLQRDFKLTPEQAEKELAKVVKESDRLLVEIEKETEAFRDKYGL